MKAPKFSQASLTEGPVVKSLLCFSIPLLISNMLQQLYNSVDSAIVGTFAGDVALAAVGGTTGSLVNLLIGFFLGISTGTGVLYAMHYGASDYPGLKKLIDSALVLSAAAGIVIGTLGAVFSRQMLVWMDTPADIIPGATKYLRIVLGGMIVTMIYNVAAGMIRAEGDSARPLLYLVVGGVVNLVLDLIFVAGLGWSVTGAAIATVAAQAVTAILSLIRLTRLPEEYRLRFDSIKVDRLVLWDITRISVPCGLQGSMFNISNLLVQTKINAFGTIAVAGVTAYSKIDGFVYMPVMAISLACSTFVGQNIGAGQYLRVKKGIRVCLITSILVSLFMALAVILSGRNLIGIFTKEPSSQSFALQMMWYMAPFAWVFTFSDVLGGAIRGAGAAMKVTIISALCICVFRVVWLFTLLHFFSDIRIVFLCYPISWTLSSVVMTLYYFKGSAIQNAIRSTT